MAKILYLEDEPFLGQVVFDTLEEQSFEVDWVKSGKTAIDHFKKNTYDICLLDVMVPDLDGFSVGKQIRAQNATIPIVFITAKSQGSDVVEGFDVGGTEYIKKPFTLDELQARLQNQLRLAGNFTEASGEIALGSFKLDLTRLRLLAKDGTEQKLTHRECEILRLICNASNYTIERKILLMEIWGDDSYYNSRNLDVYIKKIRNYLASDTTIELITLKGVGYKLVF